MEFVTLPNDVAVQTPIANLTSADVTLDTDGRYRSFNENKYNEVIIRHVKSYVKTLSGMTLSGINRFYATKCQPKDTK